MLSAGAFGAEAVHNELAEAEQRALENRFFSGFLDSAVIEALLLTLLTPALTLPILKFWMLFSAGLRVTGLRIFGWLHCTLCFLETCSLHYDPINTSWAPIRDNLHLHRLLGLDAADHQRAKIGNQTMHCTGRIMSCAIAPHIPCFLENPVHSTLWLVGPIVSYLMFLQLEQFAHF